MTSRLLEITHYKFEHIDILWKKPMDKVAIEEIKEIKWTKREEK
jgi:hypothetical protein